MMWWNNYVGIPFKCDGRDRSGADCYGLVALIYQEQLGIELNLFNGVFINQSFSCLKNVARVMEEEREKWERVEKPIVFDVILLRFSEYVWHCGVIIGNKKMIHVMTGINSCIENYNSITWRQRVAEFRRYKNHSFA